MKAPKQPFQVANRTLIQKSPMHLLNILTPTKRINMQEYLQVFLSEKLNHLPQILVQNEMSIFSHPFFNTSISLEELTQAITCLKRLCKIRYGCDFSKYGVLKTGLPQGSVSSYTLFNIYINDLVHQLRMINGVRCPLYADDLVIWTESPKKQATQLINHGLNLGLRALVR
ncbi:reverse transcriptase domain-containing protein [Trichonephila inaurata madagascariensis]|uniref:Reverse transcriptase domain-containing protein n=1 Tax=Trichonephila inaurata madagascariensis TaxID=2747483 RepID=A0A8X7C5K0_9ARAC|nr:reverse transcriptase domain-containing protein [Trichonephila inaurata madagascariensis]